MEYLIAEIVSSLAVAALLGLLTGWWLRAARGQRGDREQLEKARKDAARLEARLREIGPESMLLEPRVAELERELEAARREAADARARLDERPAAEFPPIDAVTDADPDREIARLQLEIATLKGRAEAAENRLVAFARDQGETESDAAAASDAEEALGERMRNAQKRITDLQDALFAQEARYGALRDQLGRMREEARRSGEDLVAERDAHRATEAALEELRAVHADCDFAFSALRDQIVLLRGRIAALERTEHEDAGEEDEAEQRLGNGTSGL